MPKRKLSPLDIETIQTLSALRVPRAQIAKHYGVSAPLIQYHTHYLDLLSIEEIITLLPLVKELLESKEFSSPPPPIPPSPQPDLPEEPSPPSSPAPLAHPTHQPNLPIDPSTNTNTAHRIAA